MCTSASWDRGATLVELVIFIVIISLAVAGVLLVMNRVTTSSADALVRKQALAVAESLLEEIELQGVSGVVPNPGTMANANRSGFDNVFNYNGYTTTAGILDFSTNAAIAGLSAYNITPAVTVTSVTLGGVPAVRIDVHVTGPGGQIDLTGYRAGN